MIVQRCSLTFELTPSNILRLRRQPVYIETKINCDLDTLWLYTQNPALHQQWDLRFSEIKYLPKNNPSEPQRFLYSTKIGSGIKVNGIGESVATKTKSNGESTSVLKFSSNSQTSIIEKVRVIGNIFPKRTE